MVVARKNWTDAALLALPRDGQKYELLGGDVVVSPTRFQHGYVAARLAAALMAFALEYRLGFVVDSSTGFRMHNGDCLSPDVSFVVKERLGRQTKISTRFFQGAPDLAVEVLSPRESKKKLKQKLMKYFANGTTQARVVNPKERKVQVYCSAQHFETLRENNHLDGAMVLPGFKFALKRLFAVLNFGG